MARRSRSTAVQDAWRPWILRVLGSLVLLALVRVSPLWMPVLRLEQDLWSSLTAPAPPPAGVLIVGIDEPSLAALKLAPPLPRRLHAQLVDALSEAGAAGLGVDLLLSAGQTAEDDAALARALQGRLPVVLASADVVVRSSQVAQYQQHVASIYPQARHGSVAMPVDDDGVVRAAPGEEGALWRQLALAAGRAIVVPPPGALLRHYAPEVALPYVHFTQALEPSRFLPEGALRNKLVLLGQHTPVGGVDQLRTPWRVLGDGLQSGVMLHARPLSTASQATGLFLCLLSFRGAGCAGRGWGGRAYTPLAGGLCQSSHAGFCPGGAACQCRCICAGSVVECSAHGGRAGLGFSDGCGAQLLA